MFNGNRVTVWEDENVLERDDEDVIVLNTTELCT